MLKSYLLVFFVSMVPLIELRGAIPIGLGMGLPISCRFCAIGSPLSAYFKFEINIARPALPVKHKGKGFLYFQLTERRDFAIIIKLY